MAILQDVYLRFSDSSEVKKGSHVHIHLTLQRPNIDNRFVRHITDQDKTHVYDGRLMLHIFCHQGS